MADPLLSPPSLSYFNHLQGYTVALRERTKKQRWRAFGFLGAPLAEHVVQLYFDSILTSKALTEYSDETNKLILFFS